MMIVDVIRHGMPVGGNLYRGHGVDDELSEKGWLQMRGAVGNYCGWDLVISSPMRRCLDFAKEVSHSCSLPLKIEDNFKEVGFGSWEGKKAEQIDPVEFQAFYDDPVNNRPPGSEPLELFIQRVADCFDKVIKEHDGKNVLIVAHAGVIRAMITHVLRAHPSGMYKLQIDNGTITRFKVTPRDGTALVMLNGTLS